MENISSTENQKTMEKLKKGLGRSYDLFLYGDKASGTKPGNIQVYGTIVGQREILRERRNLQRRLEDEEQREF